MDTAANSAPAPEHQGAHRKSRGTTAPPKLNSRGVVIRQFVVRLEEPEYEKVRERAYADRSTLADVIRSALRRYL